MRNLYLLKEENLVLQREKGEKRYISDLSFNSSCNSSIIVCSLGEINEPILIEEIRVNIALAC